MLRFTVPRDIYYGNGSLSVLKKLDGKKAMLVTGGGAMKRFGFLQIVTEYLEKGGMQTAVFSDAEPQPSMETVMSGAAAMREFQPDWIIAIGGGSAIDAAKAMWIFYEYPDMNFGNLLTPFSLPPLRKKARFVAIPSTSGTGSAVTSFSVITDYAKGIKYPIADYKITPDIAIIDPRAALSMSKLLTSHTGMDVLSNAIEAYVSTLSTPFTDPLALKAAQMVFEYLPSSFEGDVRAREKMHYAQCIAGMSFSNAFLGVAHSLANKTCVTFSTGNIPHGCANAIYLPYVIKYNSMVAASKYADIARAIGLEGSKEELIQGLCNKIKELNAVFSIPDCLSDFGIDEEEFNRKLPDIARSAAADVCTASNPRHTTAHDMERLLKCIYYGQDVDF